MERFLSMIVIFLCGLQLIQGYEVGGDLTSATNLPDTQESSSGGVRPSEKIYGLQCGGEVMVAKFPPESDCFTAARAQKEKVELKTQVLKSYTPNSITAYKCVKITRKVTCLLRFYIYTEPGQSLEREEPAVSAKDCREARSNSEIWLPGPDKPCSWPGNDIDEVGIRKYKVQLSVNTENEVELLNADIGDNTGEESKARYVWDAEPLVNRTCPYRVAAMDMCTYTLSGTGNEVRMHCPSHRLYLRVDQIVNRGCPAGPVHQASSGFHIIPERSPFGLLDQGNSPGMNLEDVSPGGSDGDLLLSESDIAAHRKIDEIRCLMRNSAIRHLIKHSTYIPPHVIGDILMDHRYFIGRSVGDKLEYQLCEPKEIHSMESDGKTVVFYYNEGKHGYYNPESFALSTKRKSVDDIVPVLYNKLVNIKNGTVIKLTEYDVHSNVEERPWKAMLVKYGLALDIPDGYKTDISSVIMPWDHMGDLMRAVIILASVTVVIVVLVIYMRARLLYKTFRVFT